MTENITEFLLQHFPDRSTLSREDFSRAGKGEDWTEDAITWYVYNGNFEWGELSFQNISRPWPEIDWFEIGNNGWETPGFLNKKSFIHAFPSLLNYLYILPPTEPGKGGDLLSSNFVNRLNLDYVKKLEDEIYGAGRFNWIKDFYGSLSEEIKKVICQILFFVLERDGVDFEIEDALASYWIQFA